MADRNAPSYVKLTKDQAPLQEIRIDPGNDNQQPSQVPQTNQPTSVEMAAQTNQSNPTETAAQPIEPEVSRRNWISYFQYKPERDSANDVRNALLVVTALIAAATFQVGCNPPGGVWQETQTVEGKTNYAGKAIMASNGRAFTVFIFCNTFAFNSSVLVIIYLVYQFPFYLLTWMALCGLTFTYAFSVTALLPPEKSSDDKYLIMASVLPWMLSIVQELIKKCRARAAR
ncbi:hypothetical protein CJ030_MR3G014745 [Morella rubra]|uniref:PGG domain-containing protein n=1 Tax=Morella rubra TaxID=262757 RepID=A0A6A1VYG9_9ROSI|nr:hypothetical protein CJ030_MR3G014745 [Morella rubra]